MKLILYSAKDIHAKAIEIFLNKNNLNFNKEIINSGTSYLKIIKSHSIEIIERFNEFALNQLIDHIKKYNSKT